MNLIFDFDGTICDSLDAFIAITNPALRLLRKEEISKKEIRQKGALTILKDKKVPNISLPFILIYGRMKVSKIIPNQKPFNNLPKTIKKLAENNTLGIVTSNSKRNVIKFLQNNGLENHFTFIYSSVNYFNKSARITGALKKHNLEKKDTFFIGDETRDIRSAKLVGIKTVAVTWGTENKKLLEKSKPNHVVNKPSELFDIVNK